MLLVRLALLLTVGFTLLADPPRPSGATLYRDYCASCHGLDARGGGPAAAALLMRPTDLTTLAAKYKGKFPSRRVEQLLGGGDGIPAHGGKQMPVWGPGLRSPDDTRALIQYLESLKK